MICICIRQTLEAFSIVLGSVFFHSVLELLIKMESPLMRFGLPPLMRVHFKRVCKVLKVHKLLETKHSSY